jgi:hypothetical protein
LSKPAACATVAVSNATTIQTITAVRIDWAAVLLRLHVRGPRIGLPPGSKGKTGLAVLLTRIWMTLTAPASVLSSGLTPMRVDRYRFVTSESPEQLRERVPSLHQTLDVLCAHSRDERLLQLTVAYPPLTRRRWQLQARRRWPRLIARCEARIDHDGSQVDVVMRLSRSDYLWGMVLASIVGFAFYGALSQSVSVGIVLACTALIWFHVGIVLDRQNPDELATIIAYQLDLRPPNVAEARVRRGD